MKNTWVISDTHFNHENILKFNDGRGDDFDTIEEMNETIIDNWNNVVNNGDRVYHLGDVFFGSKDDFKKLWPRLNGSKRLIIGNHDDVKFLSTGGLFKKVTMWRMFPEFNCVLSHVPLHGDCLWRTKSDTQMLNIHGHTHRKGSPEGPYKSVCVELTGYAPVNIEELTC